MARSFVYMPQEISKFIVQNVNMSQSDTRIETPMAQGTHLRAYGDSVVKKVAFRLVVPRSRMVMVSDFFGSVRNRTFWALFPMQNDPRIIAGKYYCFYFSKSGSFSETTVRADYFDTPVEWDWHYLVPARDYGQQ